MRESTRAFLETVLTGAGFGENLDRIRAFELKHTLQIGTLRPEEGIGRPLLRHRRRNRRQAFLTALRNFLGAGLERRVAGLNREREAGVGLRIFMSAINPGLVRQRRELAEAGPHLCWRAFEKPAAPESEKRVAAKKRCLARKPIGDVATGMAGHVEDLGIEMTEATDITLTHLDVDAGDAARIGTRTDDGAAGFPLQLKVAADMIAMMVGVQDVGERPIFGIERRQDRSNDGGIDDPGGLGFRIVDEINVIVVQNRNLADLKLAVPRRVHDESIASPRKEPTRFVAVIGTGQGGTDQHRRACRDVPCGKPRHSC